MHAQARDLHLKQGFKKCALAGLHGQSTLKKKVGSKLENELGLKDRDDRRSAKELGSFIV